MKKAPRIFGHSEVAYPIGPIVVEEHAKYLDALNEFDAIRKAYDDKEDFLLVPKLFKYQHLMFRSGTIAIVLGVTLLDQVIYRYACRHIHHDEFEKITKHKGFVWKWISLPKICENKKIEEDSSVITHLKELISARNAIVHQKVS